MNDLQNIVKNPVTLIVLGGLTFLPSLYAWFNISASWDPYSQTDKLPVGVVNEDKGAIIREKQVDVGEEVIQALKDNKGMDWHFLNKTDAMEQLEKGHLFAVIIIPDDFTSRLGTVLEKEPQKATIEYYVNEKINAIAPKITEKGASVIVEQVSKQFIETVNGIIFSFFNEIGVELEKELPEIQQLEAYVFELEERLPDIHEALENSLDDASTALKTLNQAEKELPTIENILEQGLSMIDEMETLMDQAEDKLKETMETIETNSESINERIEKIEKPLENIQNTYIHLKEELESLKELQSDIDDYRKQIEQIESTLNGLLDSADDLQLTDEQKESLEQAIETLQNTAEFLSNSEEVITQVETQVLEKEAQLTDLQEQLSETKESVTENLYTWKEAFETSIVPKVEEEVAKVRDTLHETNKVLLGLENKLPDLEGMIRRTKESLQEGESLLQDVLEEYPFIYEKTTQLAKNIRKIHEEADIKEIIELLKNDPEAEKDFLSNPVLLNENKMFPIENYGSGMTPFYTLLSLWVGGLLLISLLSTDVMQPEQYLSRDIYFGKLYLFLLIGCLQTIIVTLGDIFILNVQMANPIWFILFGILCSMIFMTLIYTFVSLFGNVGKAMAIIMLVLQIAGSGGTYPVALLPEFFQKISPFLPFTYAVGLMREAVGGIVWENVMINTTVLVGIGFLVVIIGTLLKGVLNQLAEKYLGESEDDGIFH